MLQMLYNIAVSIDKPVNTLSVDTDIADPLDRWEAETMAQNLPPSISELQWQKQLNTLKELAYGEGMQFTDEEQLSEFLKFLNHIYLSTEPGTFAYTVAQATVGSFLTFLRGMKL